VNDWGGYGFRRSRATNQFPRATSDSPAITAKDYRAANCHEPTTVTANPPPRKRETHPQRLDRIHSGASNTSSRMLIGQGVHTMTSCSRVRTWESRPAACSVLRRTRRSLASTAKLPRLPAPPTIQCACRRQGAGMQTSHRNPGYPRCVPWNQCWNILIGPSAVTELSVRVLTPTHQRPTGGHSTRYVSSRTDFDNTGRQPGDLHRIAAVRKCSIAQLTMLVSSPAPHSPSPGKNTNMVFTLGHCHHAGGKTGYLIGG